MSQWQQHGCFTSVVSFALTLNGKKLIFCVDLKKQKQIFALSTIFIADIVQVWQVSQEDINKFQTSKWFPH